MDEDVVPPLDDELDVSPPVVDPLEESPDVDVDDAPVTPLEVDDPLEPEAAAVEVAPDVPPAVLVEPEVAAFVLVDGEEVPQPTSALIMTADVSAFATPERLAVRQLTIAASLDTTDRTGNGTPPAIRHRLVEAHIDRPDISTKQRESVNPSAIDQSG